MKGRKEERKLKKVNSEEEEEQGSKEKREKIKETGKEQMPLPPPASCTSSIAARQAVLNLSQQGFN